MSIGYSLIRSFEDFHFLQSLNKILTTKEYIASVNRKGNKIHEFFSSLLKSHFRLWLEHYFRVNYIK
jgi:hypothetical protein